MRFTEAAMQIPDLNPEVQLHAIKSGIRPGKFQEAIAVAKPKTLEEFREKAQDQIEIEELREARKSEKPTKKEEERPQWPSSKDIRKPFKLAPKFDTYTKFNTRREDIIKEILHNKFIKPPVRAGSYQDQKYVDKSKHCAFHQKFGHTTDECIVAKDLLERLARQGLLDKYVSTRKQREERESRHKQVETPPSKGIINYISRGFAGGGSTTSARKRSYRAMMAMEESQPERQTSTPISRINFSTADFKSTCLNLDDPVVISIHMGELTVKKVLLDPGSSADVLFYSTFKKMHFSDNALQPSPGELVGFSGEKVSVSGYIWIRTTIGEPPYNKTLDIQFLVVDCPSPYNIILGRPSLNAFGAIVSTVHFCVKFPLQNNVVGTVYADHKEARQCYNASLKAVKKEEMPRIHTVYNSEDIPTLAELDPRNDNSRPTPMDDLEKVKLGDENQRFTNIGSAFIADHKADLVTILKTNADLFAWTPADMPGIDPNFICHKLPVNPSARPIRQKKRNLGDERRKAAEVETKKLLEAGFIRELRFSAWLANIVMVRKSSGKWRMCVDFTDLNKACPKDGYPLPNIDRLVDNTSGFPVLSFMDAYSGYNQILMHLEDEEKMAFVTDQGNFCYKVMPFGLKNAGATYQRLMDKVFKNQIGRNIEIYVDDMVVKSTSEEQHKHDLNEIFGQLRKHNMRLNPDKCAFGVKGGKFLGFLLTNKGIEANPDKCLAVINMQSPRNKKEVQQLTGRLAALSRFLPAAAEKSHHFFNTLKKSDQFTWTKECEEAFTKFKNTLGSPPILKKPEQGKPLHLFLSISTNTISSVLVTDDKEQHPVYFISKVLHGAETRYPMIEKLAFRLIITARRLRHYFQEYRIIVRTNQPLRQVLAKPDLGGRLTKWSVELSEFDITYQSRGSPQAQALADFISEFTNEEEPKSWKLYVDGASNDNGCGAGILLKDKQGVHAEQSIKFQFQATNNQAEYEALLAGLKLAKEIQVPSL
ncbi:uncharacterized protein [Arachis hypogaea]|uniref:uncharacterized protein n=1 Tax=Arachis hypogaea TaxID=3818 RepID=UPI003B2237BE